MRNRIGKFLLLLAFFGIAMLMAYLISNSISAKEAVARFGYVGMTVMAYVCGLNIVIPVPIETFVPVFVASGLPAAGIIASLVIGTTAADLTAYGIAWYGGKSIDLSKWKFLKKLNEIEKKNAAYALATLFVWAAVIPLPNELVIVPLGLAGYRLRSLLIPFILGNIAHHALVVFGFSTFIPFL